MHDLEGVDRAAMSALTGLLAGPATLHSGINTYETSIVRDTLERSDDFGLRVIESGEQVTYLQQGLPRIQIGDWFETGDVRLVVEYVHPTADDSLGMVDCRVAHSG